MRLVKAHKEEGVEQGERHNGTCYGLCKADYQVREDALFFRVMTVSLQRKLEPLMKVQPLSEEGNIT
jgi:hypothetical protein